jgi:hypothetical protein
MIVVDELNISGVILTNSQMGIEMEFFVRIVFVIKIILWRQDRPVNEVESYGLLWNLVESCPVIIKVGFLSESAS